MQEIKIQIRIEIILMEKNTISIAMCTFENFMEKGKFLKVAGLCLQQKCPKCGKEKIFKKNTEWIAFPEMHKLCPNCHYKFDREPGYFLGAMFVSYALAVGEGLVTFILLKLIFTQMEYFTIAFTIAIVILLFSIWNYKQARVIWINLFP